jgi:alpha-1,3-glucosyltransferase
MADYVRSREPSGSHRRTLSGSHQSIISNSRSFRLDSRVEEEEGEASGSQAVRGDTSRRRQENGYLEDYLKPLPNNSRRSRSRVDSLTSVGSSVAPGALPRWQGRGHSATRQLSPRENGHNGSSGSAITSGGGLEAWLQSQAPPGSSTQATSTSYAPSGRIRKMNAVDEGEIGSDAGRSTGAKSAGPRMNGSRREYRNRMSPMPDWDPSALDADAAGLGNDSRKLENVLRWRDSNTRSTTRERTDLSDFDSQIASESRMRKREKGPGSFSASGLSVLREGPRKPRSRLSAEPTLDALLSTSRSEHGIARSGLPRSHADNGGNTLTQLILSTAEESTIKEEREADPLSSPLRSFVRWFLFEGTKSSGPASGYDSKSGTYLLFLVVILTSILLKWITGLGSWSGRANPPMYGDFEAQRHWMEITLHLPRSQWYFYDLRYWGLDYPPLTAIVSRWCAQIATLIPGLAPSLALDSSRGNEAGMLIVYMRATVLVLDLLVYTPAVLYFSARKLQGRGRRTRAIAAVTILLQPSLVLIDYGHFQYNTVMLGLSAAAFSLLYTSLPNPDLSVKIDAKMQQDVERRMASLSRKVSYEYIAAAVFFSLSLCFKQMALYFAPAVFAVMLGRCWGLSKIGVERG